MTNEKYRTTHINRWRIRKTAHGLGLQMSPGAADALQRHVDGIVDEAMSETQAAGKRRVSAPIVKRVIRRRQG